MVVVACLLRQPERQQGVDFLRHHVNHARLVLQTPRDHERGLQIDDEPSFFEQRRPQEARGRHRRDPRLSEKVLTLTPFVLPVSGTAAG